MLQDPVCGKRMNRVRPHIIINHDGVDYYLCCSQCQAEFERAPGAYAKPEWGRPGRGQRGRTREGRRKRQG